MRLLLLAPALVACTSSPPDGRWQAILVNGGGSVDVNYASHRVHLEGMVDTLTARGLSTDQLMVLASDGADPTPDLLTVAPVPDSGAIPEWLVGPGPLFDPGGPLAHLWPPMEVVDTAWTRTRVAPATGAQLANTLANTPLNAGDTLFLYTTDHGEPDGSLSMWNEPLPPEALADQLRSTPDGVRVVVAMSQCHSGAFAEPLLELRDEGIDVCGIFSVPSDRQATGCFPERDGPPLGHGFRIAEALASATTLDEAQALLIRSDRSPDVPISTSDVALWQAILDESERRNEDVSATVDRLLAGAPADPILDDLARRIGQPTPTSLASVQRLTDRWLDAIDAATLQVDDLAAVRGDAIARVQQVALDTPSDAPWADRMNQAARDVGVAHSLPRLAEAHVAADARLWTWTVQEAVLARMGWRLARSAGRSLMGDDPALADLLACEATPLPGTPVPASPTDWSARGDLPTPPALAWAGIRLHTDGLPRVTAVHPEGPAATLVPGTTIQAIDGQRTPTVEAIVAHFALATPGTTLQLTTDTGSTPLTLAAWPALLTPMVVPDAGMPAPDALSWLTTPPTGAHLILWTADQCPTCSPALDRTRVWAENSGYDVVVVDDVMPGGLPGALPDLGGWTADAFAVDMLPTIVAVDATGHIAWRVDGWSPSEGIDLPPLPGENTQSWLLGSPHAQPAHTAHGTPVP